jgi:hypothetical protein
LKESDFYTGRKKEGDKQRTDKKRENQAQKIKEKDGRYKNIMHKHCSPTSRFNKHDYRADRLTF